MVFDSNEVNSELAYDLRQAFAFIVGRILDKIEFARENKDFPEWFKQLDNLYIEIDKKLKPKEREDYEKLLIETIQNINKYPNTYNRLDASPQSINFIYSSLRKLNLWLGRMMDEHNLFGNKRDIEGLV
jgi:hypothetical protein